MPKSDAAYTDALHVALEHTLRFLNTLEDRSVAATDDLLTLRRKLHKELTSDGIPAEHVIHDLARDADGGLNASPGGRFFAWVIGGSVPAALAADWLTSAWDQNAGLYACTPAAAVVEEVAGSWLKELLGLPAHASFAFVTGCQMAHATCLAAARYAVLKKHGWDVEERGLFGAPRIRMLASRERHGTIERAVRLLGLGKNNVELLPVDDQHRFSPDALARVLEQGPSSPTVVMLQAGDVNTGVFDDFEALIPIAKRHGAWVHVDGAMGLWANVSPQYRHLLKGVELADSWATDGHKWLNVPYDSGYAFVADVESHRACMSHRAAYLAYNADARDELDWNPEHSRRARGFATYAAIRQLGRNGIRDLVERCCRFAHEIVTRIGALDGAEIVWEPIINQGLVRFLDPRPDTTEQDHDRRTDEVIAAILKTGEAFFGGTTWDGKRAMRVSVSSWQTTDEDVNRTVRAVEKVLVALTSSTATSAR